MNESIKIDGREDIIRDVNSKAIIKTSLQEKKVWLRKKERNNKILSNENEINKVKEELFEVKTILNESKDFLRKSN